MNILEELNAIGNGSSRKLEDAPNRSLDIRILKACMSLLWSGYYLFEGKSPEDCLAYIRSQLGSEIGKAFRFAEIPMQRSEEQYVEDFIQTLPAIKKVLLKDLKAIYEGDPAAIDEAEVLITYPGFRTITIYRIAHQLWLLGVPMIPRILTEYAHSRTGIDIHPGATIGEAFCIDHGTGIVIGETATLGHHVKLYQGVTIGAKSFELDENGNPVKGGKRHPDIGNHVVIYANATILGGSTVIGDHCTIGGSVWLTHSLPEGTTITYNPDHN